MKKIFCLLLAVLFVFSACDMRGDLWGVYSTDLDESGNGKTVEFAYSKVFYTLDILTARSEEQEAQSEDGGSEAVIEGWYDKEGDSVVCTFSLVEEGKTHEHVYTFRAQGDTLTLIGHTVDGTDVPFESEVYKK